jgi:hypothetical protein
MDESLRTGRGRYAHDDSANGWGLWDAHLPDSKTILVDTTYSHPREHKPVVSGYIWKKLPEG